ncbi:hypothetical protein R6Q59_023533 [Mikania micrantha]
MALLRKLFYKKPPDGLLEISERVYVFDCCFTTDAWDQENYKGYVGDVVNQLKDHYPEASILVFNFREGDTTSQLASALSSHDMTIVEYPRHYEGCPLLSMEAIHHYLRSCESWLSFGVQNILLMHCEHGGWPVLAFMLAALLIYSKHYSGESKTLDMVYKQAPSELLHLFSSLNPLPSQLRYLQYVSRRNVATEWPPLDRALSLDCVMMRMIPDVDGNGGCCPIFSIYGQDPYMPGDRTTKLLFTTPKRSKNVRYYKQVDCEIVIIDIGCHIQGDIVLECINLHDDWEHENLMYRAMFNTSFIRSNILILNRYEIDVLWDSNYQFPDDFKAEFLFSEMDAAASIVPVDSYFFQKSEGLPIEAFAKVQEMFNSVDWLVPKNDAAYDVLHQMTAPDHGQDKELIGPLKNDPMSCVHLAKEKIDNSQTFLNSSTSSISSSASMPLHNLSTHEPVHPYLCVQQVTGDKESPAKSDQPFQKSVVNEVKASPPDPPSQTASPTQSTFLPPSLLLKDIDTKVGPSPSVLSLGGPSSSSRENQSSTPQTPRTPGGSLVSPPPSPPTPPLRDKLAMGSRPTPPLSPNRLTPPSQEKLDMKSGPTPPRSPPPPTAPLKEKITPPPSQLLSPPPKTAPTKEREKTIPPSQPISAPPTTASKKEKTTPPPSQPISPPRTTAPMKEKTTSPSSQRVSPPPTTAPTKEKNPPPSQRVSPPPIIASMKGKGTAPPSQPISSPPTTTHTKEKRTPTPSQPVSPPPTTVHTKEKRNSPSSQQTSPPPTTSPVKDKTTPPPSQPVSPPFTMVPMKEKPDTKAGSYTPVGPPPALPPPPPTISLKEIPKIPPPPQTPMPPPPPPPARNQPPPPPPIPSNQNRNGGGVPPPPPPSRGANLPGAPAPPPPLGRGRGLSLAISKNQNAKKLKPLHWLKLTRAVQGSLWAETSKSGEAVKTPEIDIKELENLFSAANPNSEKGATKSKSATIANKPEKVQLIDHRRAYNCEIMLSKVKIPLHELMDYVLALDESALDADQVENLIKFCPTKEEMELLKGYKGERDKLGKCEQFFLELMKVPRTESKLKVFSFKLQFGSQVSDLRKSLNSVNSAVEQVRSSSKFKRVMQTILTLGNALNQGTARGSAVGFRLDSLLKLTDTRARNTRMTLMHYLCKVLADKLPELLDFSKDLDSLEPASKVQLKYLAEEMQTISKGLEKVVQELSTAENDGPVSEKFRKALKEFLCSAEGEARALASLYSLVGKSVDALILYFGEDPARCPYEHVVSTLRNFVRMFIVAHDENCKQIEAEKKKAEKEKESSTEMPKNDSSIVSDSMKKSLVKTVE